MPSFSTRLRDGWEQSQEHIALALVPLVTALLNTEKLSSVLTFDGIHVGLRFGLPISVVDLWTFVDPPSQGVNVSVGVPLVDSPLALIAIPLGVIIQTTLGAGYFGSIEDSLSTGSFSFGENVRQFFVPFLLLTLIPLLVFLPLALVGLGGGFDFLLPLLVLLVPAMIAAGYLFYATPYLLVLRETGLIPAARRSYELAVEGGPYLSYFLGFLLFVVVVSPVASILVVNIPIVGLMIGLVGSAVLGLAANFATMRFVSDIDPGSPSLGSWDDGFGPKEALGDSRDETATAGDNETTR